MRFFLSVVFTLGPKKLEFSQLSQLLLQRVIGSKIIEVINESELANQLLVAVKELTSRTEKEWPNQTIYFASHSLTKL